MLRLLRKLFRRKRKYPSAPPMSPAAGRRAYYDNRTRRRL